MTPILEHNSQKRSCPQSFSENVRQLLHGFDGLKLHPVLLHTFTNEMIANVDMLTAIMEDRVLAERDGRLIVDLQSDSTGFLALELSK